MPDHRAPAFSDTSSRHDIAQLKRRLLRLGGDRFQHDAFLDHELQPAFVAALLRKGRTRVPPPCVVIPGNPRQCHENAERFRASHGWAWETGLALSDDGAWRVHSWNVRRDGCVVESTQRRLIYFGVDASHDPEFGGGL